MSPRILIVGAQHGDERLGPRLQRFLKAERTGRYQSVDYLSGNPRALRLNTRFTETDLNRSYNTQPPRTYEQKRAQKILRYIAAGNYDCVVDIHTSRADVGRFFLATQCSGAVTRIINASDFDRVAIMPPDIADCSLIGQVPQAISIEYNRRLARSKRALQELVLLLDNLLDNRPRKPRERQFFYVDGTIPLDCPVEDSAQNFELCAQGFYPIIFKARAGSYATHQGFMARRREVRFV
ncbi:MAG TPA: succinylglutamate desuccinylase/aspartoacylase family protein [Candidatus Saccharimonadales bacterium]|nr:succinylglutamate desuccinylase/aspartoacylase family protein [Candidatus Saccharimonadales bacterium]